MTWSYGVRWNELRRQKWSSVFCEFYGVWEQHSRSKVSLAMIWCWSARFAMHKCSSSFWNVCNQNNEKHHRFRGPTFGALTKLAFSVRFPHRNPLKLIKRPQFTERHHKPWLPGWLSNRFCHQYVELTFVIVLTVFLVPGAYVTSLLVPRWLIWLIPPRTEGVQSWWNFPRIQFMAICAGSGPEFSELL